MKTKFIILILFILFVFPYNVYAIDSIGSSNSDAIKVCEYEAYYDVVREYGGNDTIASRLVAIFFIPSSNKWEVIQERKESSDNDVKVKWDEYKYDSHFFETISNDDYLEISEMLKTFKCPSYGYPDMSDYSDYRILLSEEPLEYSKKTEYEKEEVKDFLEGMTSWQTRVYKLRYTKKVYDLNTEVTKSISKVSQEYLNTNFKVDENKTSISEDDFCNKIDQQTKEELANNAEKELEDTIRTNLINTLFPNSGWSKDDIPSWLLNNKGYSTEIQKKLTEAQESCNKIIENDNTLTEEEKEEKKEEFKEKFETMSISLENYVNQRINNTIIFSWDDNDDSTCQGFLGNKECGVGKNCDPAYYLDLVFKLVKYSAIVLVFVLSIIDFIRAIASQDKDQLNKAIQSAVKRLIAAIIIFFVPIVLNFILGLLGAYDTCGIY